MTFATPFDAHVFAWFQATCIVVGSLGLVLACVAIARDQHESRSLWIAERTLLVLIAGWFLFTGGVAVFAQDLTCGCNACAGIDPYSLLWYLQGCWL